MKGFLIRCGESLKLLGLCSFIGSLCEGSASPAFITTLYKAYDLNSVDFAKSFKN